jgi:hypothetical protein
MSGTEVHSEVESWVRRVTEIGDTYNATLSKKPESTTPEREAVKLRIQQDCHKQFEELYRTCNPLLISCLYKLAKSPGGIESAPVASRLILFTLEMLSAHQGTYFTNQYNSMEALLTAMEKIRNAFIGNYPYRPLISLEDLELGDDLVRILFLFNGILTVGELETMIQSNQPIRGFGDSKYARTRTAMQSWRAKNTSTDSGQRKLDPAKLKAIGDGLWHLTEGGRDEYLIELSPVQVLHLNKLIPLSVMADGSGIVLVRLSNLQP